MGIFYRWVPEPIVLRRGVKGERLKKRGGWRRAQMEADGGETK